MIIKGALIFLGVVDFFWNAYEHTSAWFSKLSDNKTKAIANPEPAKPSYLIQ